MNLTVGNPVIPVLRVDFNTLDVRGEGVVARWNHLVTHLGQRVRLEETGLYCYGEVIDFFLGAHVPSPFVRCRPDGKWFDTDVEA